MEKGKLIVIEGTDCSGKETQSKKLIERLNDEGIKTEYMSFPMYKTPTGRIVGLPFLGKPHLAKVLIFEHFKEVAKAIEKKYERIDSRIVTIMMDVLSEELSKGWFPEGAPNVDPKVSSLYYIADRAYNIPMINETLENGTNIILDRYTYSNMAHQGSKILDYNERMEMYNWISKMEFEMMELPLSDIRLFLHMPNEYADILRKGRSEALDENEKDSEYMLRSEKAYVEVAQMYNFDTIYCVDKKHEEAVFEDIKTPDEINQEVYRLVKSKISRR